MYVQWSVKLRLLSPAFSAAFLSFSLPFPFLFPNPIPAITETWPGAVVLPEITSEAEELCSKPQEEPKTPTLSTSEPEPTPPNALSSDQVRHDNTIWTAYGWKGPVLHWHSLEVIAMCFCKLFFGRFLNIVHHVNLMKDEAITTGITHLYFVTLLAFHSSLWLLN